MRYALVFLVLALGACAAQEGPAVSHVCVTAPSGLVECSERP